MTARAIINSACEDLGIRGQGETLSAADAQTCLTRLNNLVSSWQAQHLTAVAIERQIFPLVANQQTYTIGLGGQFNVPRPTQLQGAGLLLNGLEDAQSVTLERDELTVTATATAHGYAVGDEVLIQGAVEIDYNGVQTILSVPDVDTFTFTIEATPETPATGTITAAQLNSTTSSTASTEIPIACYTDDSYQANQVKNMGSSQFTGVYYRPTQPLGQLWLWPAPTVATNQLVLYLQTVFTGFTNLSTDYRYPETPGYAEALQYNLGIRLIAPFAVSNQDVIANVRRMAGESLATIKRANVRLSDLAIDPMFTRSVRTSYNIDTGTGG